MVRWVARNSRCVLAGSVRGSAAATIASSASPLAPTSIPAPIATSRKAIRLALPAAWNRTYGVLNVQPDPGEQRDERTEQGE